MLLEAGRDGEDVRVEDDVVRVEAASLGQQPVGALADLDLAASGVRLALLVERHHDDRRAVAADDPRLAQELVLAFLQADRVDDAPCPGRTSGPASITDHFELSTMIGSRAISGSVAMRFRNVVIAASESSIPSSMLTSRMLAPPRT